MKREQKVAAAGPGARDHAPTTQPTSVALARAVRFDSSAILPRLPGTRHEALALTALFARDRSRLLLGSDASERELFDLNAPGELAKYRYVHLATHGLADSERPELSGLVLARAPVDPDYDGVLHMREVFHLKLNADLVVLSACQSGLGKHLTGEGMVGLSTAFFFAGTPSLVVSLWNVSDVSTALLMRRFYENLLKGQRKSGALREAKSWLRNLTRAELRKMAASDSLAREAIRGVGTRPVHSPKGKLADEHPYAHPYYWAPFVLIGDPR